MGVEIERKFSVVGNECVGNEWRADATGASYRQGYLSTVKERTVRVRTIDGRGLLTVKGVTIGATRSEFEYEIPVEDAQQMLEELCERPLIEKTRFTVAYGGLTWEIDEFHGVNEGLLIAEVELTDAAQAVELPPWVGEEVTDDPRYYNANLIAHPYRDW